ncbi:hypothetical protein INT44_000225 [Umbelopsis vinacea]|uniref:C2H2-type domain-containing protein n=1 Tax=Umbelopsis vinacea TaxID=44442 RepID=A0A8H7UBR6_9FUNG|nr:hypothetical protein INT44_000225 [Umbelopsis vinacea]KAI9282499.1 hypothetical protein BC943DRAFT_114090 [Umbelopsis sp. AD052]
MAGTPSLKIKLRLNGPVSKPPTESASPEVKPSPTASNISSSSKREASEPAQQSAPKRPRGGPGSRSRKPNDTAASTPQAKAVTDSAHIGVDTDDAKSEVIRSRAGTPSRQDSLAAQFAAIKDQKPRKWERQKIVFTNLEGGNVEICTWSTDSAMKMNTTKTEPTTAAEIDALFSATVNERDFRPFLCTQPGCNKSFTSFDQLQTHETNMHGTKNMICGIDGCTKGFATSGQLTKHRKMVHYRTSAKKKAATMAAKAAQKEKEDSLDIENGGEAA